MSFAADYYVAVADLDYSLLCLSTIQNPHATKEEKKAFGTRVTCLFCKHEYKWGPQRCEMHLDAKMDKQSTGVERKVSACSPTFEHNVRAKEVVEQLRKMRKEGERGEKRLRESQGADVSAAGSAHQPISVDDESGGASKRTNMMQPVTREEMNNAWAETIVANGLSIRLVDDPTFRAALVKTALCGQQAMSNKPGEGKDT
jgi:hypothetical protein